MFDVLLLNQSIVFSYGIFSLLSDGRFSPYILSSQHGYVYIHWNPRIPPFRVCSCKICIEFWDIQECDLIIKSQCCKDGIITPNKNVHKQETGSLPVIMI